MRPATVACLCALVLAACGTPSGASEQTAVVDHVADGDTIAVAGGARVRLVQIDSAELSEDECFARQAADDLRGLLPRGTRVRLEADPSLDDRDRYGRLLRYVLLDGVNLNVELVRRGDAAPYFRHGLRGRHAAELLGAADAARTRGRGMWGRCRVRWDPDHQVDARR